jgi:hypothetical protein
MIWLPDKEVVKAKGAARRASGGIVPETGG